MLDEEIRDLANEKENKDMVNSTAIMSDPGVPQTYKEASTGPNKDQWIPSMKSEIQNFLARDIWAKVS